MTEKQNSDAHVILVSQEQRERFDADVASFTEIAPPDPAFSDAYQLLVGGDVTAIGYLQSRLLRFGPFAVAGAGTGADGQPIGNLQQAVDTLAPIFRAIDHTILDALQQVWLEKQDHSTEPIDVPGHEYYDVYLQEGCTPPTALLDGFELVPVRVWRHYVGKQRETAPPAVPD